MTLKCALPVIGNASNEVSFPVSQVGHWKGIWGGLQITICLLSYFFFKFLSGSFAPLALLLTLGLCQGERREISSEFSPGNPEQFAEMQGWAESHPGPCSPSYFHWAFLFWLQFSPHPGVKTFPGERKMQAPPAAAGWSHCPPCYWGSESVAWPLILLRHLDYSYSIRHIWRKEIGLSQVADVSAGMYDWKLIPWHRLMKTAVSWNTEIHFIFFITHDLNVTYFPYFKVLLIFWQWDLEYSILTTTTKKPHLSC